MKVIEKRENKGFEIELYYPKEHGTYTDKTGNLKEVIQCDNVGEVAQFFAQRSWSAPYGDNNCANPTVWYNGTKWCFTEESTIPEKFYYKGFAILQKGTAWEVWSVVNSTKFRTCETYAECIERINNQTL